MLVSFMSVSSFFGFIVYLFSNPQDTLTLLPVIHNFRLYLIDDDRDAFRGNYGNYILIRKFEGDENDRELLLLKEYLPTLLNCKNV